MPAAIVDYLEKMVIEALELANIRYVHELHNPSQRLDFYLPDYNIYIEVKQYHTDRTIQQLSLQNNIILLQGIESVRFFVRILSLTNPIK